ncbi:MAG: VanZ family protein [Gammaproteobacteria bacterium]|jgi:VanZ family protein
METALNRMPLRYFPLWLSIGWLLIASVLYASLAPSGVPSMAPHSDKAGHFLAYFALALWFSQLYNTRVRRWWAMAFIGIGVLLECLQAPIPSRIFDLVDMVANTAGVLSGWVLGSMAGANFLARFELWLENHRT